MMLVNLSGNMSIEAEARKILKKVIGKFIGYLDLVEATGEVDKETLDKLRNGIELNYKILFRNSPEGNKAIYESQHSVIKSIYVLLKDYNYNKAKDLNKLKKELKSKVDLLKI